MAGPPPASYCTLSLKVRQLHDGEAPPGPRATLRVVRILDHYTDDTPTPHDLLWAIPEEPAKADVLGDIALDVPMGTRLLLEFQSPTDPESEPHPVRVIVDVPFELSFNITELLMT